MRWKIASGMATGAAHAAAGTPCQDACHWSCDDRWLVAVVCDGAGSAEHSRIGARHAAHTLCRELLYAAPAVGAQIDDPLAYWQDRVTCAIACARTTLKIEHAGDDAGLRDYHATVVGAIAGPDFGLFFQIGDGAGAAVTGQQWEQPVMTLPENGEYADETFFYTEDRWRAHLRFTPFPPESDLIVLMTDGAMSFAMARGGKGLDARFIAPVTRYLDSVDAQTGSHALSATLDDPRTHAITADDKTLLWARRTN